jgi:hypothetical protein
MERPLSYPRLTKCLPNESRHNFYEYFHKALRLGHCRMLAELGAQDFSQDHETRQLMDRLQTLLDLSSTHLEAETREVQAALDLRRPGVRITAAQDHAGHRNAIAEIESLIRSVKVATPSRRNIAGQALYRCYALFAASDMAHMDAEETELLKVLHESFTDDELRGMEARMIRAISLCQMAEFMQLMMPALNDAGRTAVLARLRSAMEPEEFSKLVSDTVNPLLAACGPRAA